MESSTDTLLTILITLLSAVVITLLAAITVLIITIRRVMQKAEKLIDSSNESIDLIKVRLRKSLGFAGFVKYFARKARR